MPFGKKNPPVVLPAIGAVGGGGWRIACCCAGGGGSEIGGLGGGSWGFGPSGGIDEDGSFEAFAGPAFLDILLRDGSGVSASSAGSSISEDVFMARLARISGAARLSLASRFTVRMTWWKLTINASYKCRPWH